MKWRVLNDYAAQSDCTRYTVAIVNLPIDGRVTRTYEACLNPIWRGKECVDVGRHLAVKLKTAKAAQRICEQHVSRARLESAV